MQKKILILNGPNLNLLGLREPDIYGKETIDDLNKKCVVYAKRLGFKVDFFQSNHEGKLIDKIQELHEDKYDAIVINAGAYSHSSYAILDALLSITNKPKVEVHISNIAKRDEFRHKSYLSSAVDGVIFGFGLMGYELAIKAIAKVLDN